MTCVASFYSVEITGPAHHGIKKPTAGGGGGDLHELFSHFLFLVIEEYKD
jgi:hypothetical protein